MGLILPIERDSITMLGRSQGLGAISGAAETYWGKNKGRSMEGFLEKFTTGLVIAFFILAILLNMQLF